MGCGRQVASLWFYLFHCYPSGRWCGWELLTRRGVRDIWRSRYFWHDTFGRYWNRLFKCRGVHRYVRHVSDLGEPERWHCFDCERDVPEPMDGGGP